MFKHRYPVLAVATLTFMTSALPVMANHPERVINNVEDKHNWTVTAKEKKNCVYEKVIQK